MTNTLLHKSTSGQWVPCRATKRACPRQHVTLDAGGAPVGKEDMLADVVATVKRRNKSKPVTEQLAAVRAARVELSGKEKPYAEAGKELWKEEQRLVTVKWKAAAPRDYLTLDDYAGMQELMGDAYYDSAASDYLGRYVEFLNPHLKSDGYQPIWMLPAIKINAGYGLDNTQLDHLTEALNSWATFTLSHRADKSNDEHGGYVDAYGKQRLEDEAAVAPYESYSVDDHRLSEDGVRHLRVYADGTAAPVMTVYSSLRAVDLRDGTSAYARVDDADLYAARKPLREVLGAINKVWYYPEESNPSYREKESYGARYSGWDDDTDTY